MIKYMFLMFLSLSVVGCIKGGITDKDGKQIQSESLSRLKNRLEKFPEDLQLNRDLVLEYVKLYQQHKTESISVEIVKQAEKYLSLKSGDSAIEFIFYNFKSRQVMQGYNFNEIGKLREIFTKNEIVKQKGLVTPSAMEGFIAVNRYKLKREIWDINTVIKKSFKLAIKENPRYTYSYIVIARVYQEEGKYDLALGMLNQAKRISPDDPSIYVELAETYIKKSRDKKRYSCFLDDSESLKKAISQYKKAISINSNNPKLHQKLAYLFLWYNKVNLFKHEVKKAYDLSMSNYYKAYYAESILAENHKKSFKLLNEVMESDSDNREVYGMLKRYYFHMQDWEKALEMSISERKKSSGRIQLSSIFMEYIIQKKLGMHKEADKFLKKYEKHFLSSKYSGSKNYSIYKYYSGQSSEKDLLKLKYNKCEESDVYFYMALKNLVDNNIDKTKKYLKVVVDKGHPTYLSYGSSVGLLSALSNEQVKIK